jgi:hypothetical protein
MTFAASLAFAQCGACGGGGGSPLANNYYFRNAPQDSYFRSTVPVYFQSAGNGGWSYRTAGRRPVPQSGYSGSCCGGGGYAAPIGRTASLPSCCGGGAAPAPSAGYYVNGRPSSIPQARYVSSRPAPAPQIRYVSSRPAAPVPQARYVSSRPAPAPYRPISSRSLDRPQPIRPKSASLQRPQQAPLPPCCAESAASTKTKVNRKPWLDSLLKSVRNRKATALNTGLKTPDTAAPRVASARPADIRLWTRPATAPGRPVDRQVRSQTASALPPCCSGKSGVQLARRDLPATGSLFKAPPACGVASCGGACLSR